MTNGKLENGVTYYILPRSKPEKRAEFWLVINAGSVLEDDDQRGLAHFVEHVAIRGSKSFRWPSYLDSLMLGTTPFGPDNHAYTTMDETVYKVPIATDRPVLVMRAISKLRDWAGAVEFEPAQVDKERRGVVEEWRLKRGASRRLLDQEIPLLYAGAKYAERITIGTPDVIESAPPEALARYYRDWYRPDLMAVVAVGDFESREVEEKINAEFSSLRSVEDPRPRPVVRVAPHSEALYAIESDPETPTTQVTLFSEFPHRSEATLRDHRRMYAERLFHFMLNARLRRISRRPGAPFQSAVSASVTLVRTLDAFRLSAVVTDDAIERGYAALLEELTRIERFGFLEAEFDRAKYRLLRDFRRAVLRQSDRRLESYAAEVTRNFLEGESMTGPENELAMFERFVSSYTLAEISDLAKTLRAGSRVVVVTGPDRSTQPGKGALVAIEKDVATRELAPYVEDDLVPGALMSARPPSGKITQTTNIPEIDATEWTLSNGARVVVKPTTFSADEVRLMAISHGGTSLVKDADYASARFSAQLVAEGGVGAFSADALGQKLASSVAFVRPHIHEHGESIEAHASARDLDMMFQWIYLAMTAPRRDEPAFVAWRERVSQALKNRHLSPEYVFQDEMIRLSWQNHPRRRPFDVESLSQVDLDKALSIYRERFGDASRFTFVIVGRVDLEKLKSLAEVYLGSLPSTNRKQTERDLGIRWPKGIKIKKLSMGREPKSLVNIVFHGSEKWSPAREHDFYTLRDALRVLLTHAMDVDMRKVYEVKVVGEVYRRPQEYSLSVRFACSPADVDGLVRVVLAQVTELQRDGARSQLVEQIRDAQRRVRETALGTDAFWLSALVRAYANGDDPRSILEGAAFIDAITSKSVRASAKKYLSTKQYILGVLSPESNEALDEGKSAH